VLEVGSFFAVARIVFAEGQPSFATAMAEELVLTEACY
jgi:hypothetical protein